jgi:polyisoprenoid-binding protein YceI
MSQAVRESDNHLKSADFLLAEEHPTITFHSNAVRPTGGNTFELDGTSRSVGSRSPSRSRASSRGRA